MSSIRSTRTSVDGKAVVGKGVNFAPVWETPAGLLTVVNEASSVQIPLRAVDTGDTVIYSLSSGTLPPGVFLTSAGVLEGAAPLVELDTDWTFTVRAADVEGMASERTFSLRVLDIPIPPRFVTDAGRLIAVDEGSEFSINIDATDDHSVVSIEVVAGSLPTGASIDSATGLISGTAPLVSTNTDFVFLLQATDNDGLQSTREFSIRVNNLNSPPLITTPEGLLGMFNEGDAVSVRIMANDDNGGLSWAASTGLPAGLSLSNAGVISGVLLPVMQDTTFTFEITVTDSGGLTDRRTYSMVVRDTNRPPLWRLSAGPIGIFDSGATLNLDLRASDDEEGVLHAMIDGQLPEGVTLDNGILLGTLPLLPVQAEYAFQMEAVDAGGKTASIAHSFLVRRFNIAPQWATPPGNISALSGGSSVDLPLEVSDESGTLVVFSLVAGSLPQGLVMTPQGVITGTAPAVTGTLSFSFTARAADPEGAFSDRTFNLIVSPEVNLPPVWNFPSRWNRLRVSEGRSYSATLAATDPEGGSITFSVLSGSLPPGINLDTASGHITGVMPFVGRESEWRAVLRATDASGRFADRSLVYVVSNDAPPPTWSPLTPAELARVPEGSTYLATLLASFVSGTGVYQTTSTGSVPSGFSLNSTTGVITGVMPPVGVGEVQYDFVLRATDTVAQTSRLRWFSLRGLNVPIIPVWQTDSDLGTYDEGAVVNMTLVVSDTEGVPPVLSNSGALPSGLSFNRTSGLLQGTLSYLAPRAGASVTNTFSVRATNTESGSGAIAIRTFTMTVLNSNQPPVWNTSAELGDIYDNQTLVLFTLSASDPEEATVAYEVASNLPSWVTFERTTGVLSIRPPKVSQPTRYAFGFVAVDSLDTTNRVRRDFAWNVINFVAPPPVWQTPEIIDVSELSTLAIQLVANSTDGSSVTFENASPSWRPLPAFLAISPSGMLTGTAPAVSAQTSYNFTIRARTSNGGIQTRSFNLRVLNDNPIPVWQNPAPGRIGTFSENSVFLATFSAFDANGVDYIGSGSPAIPNFLSLNASTGVLSGTLPSVSQNTDYQFRIGARDRLDTSAVVFRTFIITVSNAAAPVWVSPPAGSLGSFNERSAVAFTFSATPLGGVQYGINSGSISGLILDASTGVLSGTLPSVATSAPQTFVMRAALTDQPSTFSLRTFSVGILNVDVAPVWSTPSALGTFTEGATISIQLSATDADGTVETYSRVLGSLPTGTTLGVDGVLSGVLPQVTTDTTFSFTVRATDDDGLVADRAFTLVVDNVNAVPVWQSPEEGSIGSFTEGATISFTLVATDDEGISAYSIASGTLPVGLSLTAETGRVSGTLALVPADTTFNFVARASDAENATADRSFTLTVLNANTAPVWTTPSGTLGSVFGGSLADFTVSASDDDAITYSVVGGSLPSGLTLNSTTGAIIGTAATVAEDTVFNFTVRASDGSLFTDRAFAITVQFSGQPVLQISRSIRRRTTGGGAGLNGNLTRIFTSAPTGNTRTLTYSTWMKLCTINQIKTLFAATGSDTNEIAMTATNQIVVRAAFSSTPITRTFTMGTNGIEDPHAWMHVLVQIDFLAGNDADRCALFLNGERVTAYTGAIANTARTALLTGSRTNQLMTVGDMMMAETIVVDGSVVAPTAFGQTNPITGVWEPIAYAGTYGTNGFRLTYADNSSRAALGTDSSGRGNNFTVNNFEVVSTNAYFDSLLDVPSDYNPGATARGNYAMVDHLNPFSVARASGLEGAGLNTDYNYWHGSMGASSGKFYYEATISSTSRTGMRIGFSTLQTLNGAPATNLTIGSAFGQFGAYIGAGVAPITNGVVGTLAGATPANGDTFMLAVDYDQGKIWIGRNGSWLASGDPAADLNPYLTVAPNTMLFPAGHVGGTANFWRVNFGASGNFSHTVPAGFFPYVTTNLNTPSVTRPANFVSSVAYAGTGVEQDIVLGFQPDVVWLKNRTSASGHVLFFDSARGASTYTEVGTNTAAVTDAQGIISFSPTGFTIGTSSATNNNATNYGAYGFRANPTAGLDVVTWTGNGQTSQIIDHGLGDIPHAIVMISDAADSDRVMYHRNQSNPQNLLSLLNGTAVPTANAGVWNNTAPTSSNFTVGNLYNVDQVRYAAYVIREVEGFSRIGTYSFMSFSQPSLFNLGFRPEVILWRYSDSTNPSGIGGTFSSPRFNRALNTWTVSSAAAESSTSHVMTFVSNGVRFNNGIANNRGVHIIAFAETPQKYARASR